MIRYLKRIISCHFILLLICNSLISLEAREECWIVSGVDHDIFAAFSKTRSYLGCKDKTIVNNVECTCFECWKGCSESIENAYLNRGDSLKKVTILQGAHGIPGGGAICNKKENSGDEILDVLEEISKNTQVGLLIHSCFSGDLLSKKLIRESQNPSSSTINNACVITASSMNKLTYSYEDDLISKVLKQSSEVSLNDFFENSFKYGGLISSAQWSTIYLDQYLTNLEALSLADVIKTTEDINRSSMPSNILNCINDQKVDPIFTSPNQKLIHDWIKEGAFVSDEVIRAITLLSLNWDANVQYIHNTDSTLKKNRNKKEKKFLKKCREYYESFDGKNMISFCKNFEKSNKKFKKWYKRVSKKIIDRPLEQCIEEFFSDKERKILSDYWTWKDRINLCPQLEEMKSLIEKYVSGEELVEALAGNKITPEEKAIKLLKVYKNKKVQNASDVFAGQTILNQILGREVDISEKGQGETNKIFEATSAHLLESWVRHNLNHPVQPSDPLDEKRKKACENFTIKVNQNENSN